MHIETNHETDKHYLHHQNVFPSFLPTKIMHTRNHAFNITRPAPLFILVARWQEGSFTEGIRSELAAWYSQDVNRLQTAPASSVQLAVDVPPPLPRSLWHWRLKASHTSRTQYV